MINKTTDDRFTINWSEIPTDLIGKFQLHTNLYNNQFKNTIDMSVIKQAVPIVINVIFVRAA